MISQTYANLVRDTLELETTPSAFQIRFGGMKGVLTVVPDTFIDSGHAIAFRPSMKKFDSDHSELEITSWSKYIPVYLNRQIITVLTARGVEDTVFLDLLNKMLRELEVAMNNPEAAMNLIYRNAHIGMEENSPMKSAWHMLDAGMSIHEEWYLMGLLYALRNRIILDLQARTRIFVENGVCLLGVMDESFQLQEGEVFVQLSGLGVLTAAQVVVGRSPCLHPGDLRVLKPRMIPELTHLMDVVVFPANGNRPHPNEMSGGDLDGDLYFVIWEPGLIPLNNFPPMDYEVTVPAAPITSSSISISDIEEFYVNYMFNDNLGKIATSHMVHADFSSEGARCEECLKLAQLHSTAVDFIKTGIPATLPKELLSSQIPSFMSNTRFKSTYKSTKVLGLIHEICEATHIFTYPYFDKKDGKKFLKFDSQLLVSGFQQFLPESFEAMVEYNESILQLMKYYGIYDEMELLSGCVSKFVRRRSDNKGQGGLDLQDRLNRAVLSLRKQFRIRFWDELFVLRAKRTFAPNRKRVTFAIDVHSGSEPEDVHVDKEMAEFEWKSMQKASAWYYCAYAEEFEQIEVAPLVSFPWIVYDILCKIKLSSN